MAKISKEETWRMQGMSFALKVAKEKGIDGLEQDLKMRGAVMLPIPIDKKALDECVENIKCNTIDTVVILMAACLRDEFGFGRKRIQQFMNRFESKADCIAEDYCTWQDYIDTLREETGIEFSIRANDRDVKV